MYGSQGAAAKETPGGVGWRPVGLSAIIQGAPAEEGLSMASNAPAAPPPAVPAEVTAFAAEHGVADYVTPLLELTRSLFPTARIQMLVEEDAEIPELRYIEFRVDFGGMTVEEIVETRHRWSVGLFERCPATHARYFCLGVM